MTIRITIACPETMLDDANQFALCVGNTAADIETFRTALWEDETGKRYALASLLASPVFPKLASSKLSAPEHAPDVDLNAAARAQSCLCIWTPESEDTVPTVGNGKIVAIIGLEAGLAVPLLKLTPIALEE